MMDFLLAILLGLGEALVPVISALLVALLFFAINWVRVKVGLTKLESDSEVRSYLLQAIDNAIRSWMATHKTNNPDEVVVSVANYIAKMTPGALAHFGMDKNPEQLADLIMNRVEQFTFWDIEREKHNKASNG